MAARPAHPFSIPLARGRGRPSTRHIAQQLGIARKAPTAEQLAASDRRDAARRAERRARERCEPPRPSASVIEAFRCATCHGEWAPAGSAATGRCRRCGTPRPSTPVLRAFPRPGEPE